MHYLKSKLTVKININMKLINTLSWFIVFMLLLLLTRLRLPLITTFSLQCPDRRSDSETAEQKFFFENAIACLFFKLSSSIWFCFSCHWLNFYVNDQKHPKMYLYNKYIEWSASKSENFVRREQTKLSLKSEWSYRSELFFIVFCTNSPQLLHKTFFI